MCMNISIKHPYQLLKFLAKKSSILLDKISFEFGGGGGGGGGGYKDGYLT